MQHASLHFSTMLVIAILRTLVVTLGLLVLSPWQVTGPDSGVEPDRTVTGSCLTATCDRLDGRLAHSPAALPDEAIPLVSQGDTSPDDGCEPLRSRDCPLVGGPVASPGEPTWPMLGRMEAGGLERPPKPAA